MGRIGSFVGAGLFAALVATGLTASGAGAAGADPLDVKQLFRTGDEEDAFIERDDAGFTYVTAEVGNGQILRKINSAGGTVWERTLDVGMPDAAWTVAQGLAWNSERDQLVVTVSALRAQPEIAIATRIQTFSANGARLRNDQLPSTPLPDEPFGYFFATGAAPYGPNTLVTGFGRGDFGDFSTQKSDVIVALMGPDGVAWVKPIGTGGDEQTVAGIAVGGHNYPVAVVAGTTTGASTEADGAWIAAFDPWDGTLIERERVAITTPRVVAIEDHGPLVAVVGANGLVEERRFEMNPDRLEPAGVTRRVLGKAVRTATYGENRDLIVAGATTNGFDGEPAIGGTDVYIASLDANGGIRWSDVFGTRGDDIATDVEVELYNAVAPCEVTQRCPVFVGGYTNGNFTPVRTLDTDQFLARFGTKTVPTAPALYPYVDDRRIGLEWDEPAYDGGSPRTGYVLRVQPGNIVVNLPADAVYYELKELTNGTSYELRFSAVNDQGEGPADVWHVTPYGAPGVPGNFRHLQGTSPFALGWDAPATNGRAITKYEILVDNSSTRVFAGTATSAVISGLTNTAHTFKIRAYNGKFSAYSAEVRINPAPPGPIVDVVDLTIDEGPNAQDHLVTVRLRSAAPQPVTVGWQTAGGTATPDEDYKTASGSVVIPAGTTSATIKVRIKGDRRTEPDQHFFVRLTGTSVGTIGDGEAAITLRNDDKR